MSKTRSQLRDEVTSLLLRGGIIGLVAFTAAVAYMAIPRQLGKINPTETVQTGFRGTGMAQPEFVRDVAALEVANRLPADPGEPSPPQPGDALAAQERAWPHADVLGHLTVDNFDRLMDAIGNWVAPTAAFGPGEPDPGSRSEYQRAVTARMIQMTWAINDEWSVHVGDTGVTCYTCHRGNEVPQYIWHLPEPHSRWAGPAAMFQNVAVPERPGVNANYSTALPIDALTAFLLEDSRDVGVHGWAPRDDTGTSNASIYDTYQTYNLMMHFATSLGVNCTYCHNTRAPQDPAGHTPQWANAQIARQMVLDINNNHILPTEALLPPDRLGPMGDVAKVNCTTCHQGAAKPLLGQSMLADWPELAGPDPVYD